MLLLINKVPAIFDLTKVGEQVESTYNAEVAAILIHSDEMMALGSADLFVLRYPDHMVVGQYRKLAQKLVDA
jgi:hypothetical protein